MNTKELETYLTKRLRNSVVCPLNCIYQPTISYVGDFDEFILPNPLQINVEEIEPHIEDMVACALQVDRGQFLLNMLRDYNWIASQDCSVKINKLDSGIIEFRWVSRERFVEKTVLRENRGRIHKISDTSYVCPVGDNNEVIPIDFTDRGINIDGNHISWGDMGGIRFKLGLEDLKSKKYITYAIS